MTAKARFLGAFAVLSLLTGPARGQYFEWSVFDGGGLDPRAEITAVAQGDDGMLYLGTDRGLWAHDGQRAWPQELEPDPGVPLSALMPQGDSLWVGLRSGRVYAGPADGPLHPLASEEGFPDVAITALVRDREGHLWMGTAGEGAYVRRAGRWYQASTADGLPHDRVNDLLAAADGGIWAATDAGPAHLGLDGERRVARVPPGGAELSLCLAPRAAGGVWVGYHDGRVAGWPSAEGRPEFLPSPPGPADPVTDLAEAGGRLWVGHASGGISRTDGRSTPESARFTNRPSAPGRLDALLALREGPLLAVTDRGGLNLWNPYLSAALPDGAPVGETQAVLQRADGSCWYSTVDGLYRIPRDGQAPERVRLPGLPDDAVVVRLFEDHAARLWLGTFDHGAYRLDDGGTVRHVPPVPGQATSVLAFAEGGGRIWMGTLGGLYAWTPEGTEFVDGGIGHNFIYDVLVDRRGRPWVATDGDGVRGLEPRDDGHWVTVRHGLAGWTVYGLVQDDSGRLWAHARERGLMTWSARDTAWQPVATVPPRDRELLALALDGDGHLVAFHDGGIQHLAHPGAAPRRLGFQQLRHPPRPMTQAAHGSGPTVWFGTDRGPYRLDGALDALPEAPLVHLRQALASGHPLDAGQRVRPGRRHLEFLFTGAWQGRDAHPTFEYRLPGVEDDWRATRDNRVSFVNLPAGDYRFEVRARLGETGPPGAPTGFAFHVVAPLWQRPWFLTLATAALFALVYVILQRRERELVREQQRERERFRSRFDVLRNQVNPHFLFNSFNTLSGLIEEDRERALDYVERMAGFYRHILAHRTEDLIPLERELGILDDYLAIQRARYEDSLRVTVDVDPGQREWLLPPMTLQLLAENAIKHNALTRARPLHLTVRSLGPRTLVVENPVQARHTAVASTGLGLENLARKFQLLDAPPLRVYREGDRFRVEVPLLAPQRTPRRSPADPSPKPSIP